MWSTYYFCQILIKLEFCRQVLEKCLNNKFELMKLRVAFRDFVNTPKNPPFCPHSVFMCFAWSPKQSDIISELGIQLLVHVLETVCLLCGANWIFKHSIHGVQRGSEYNYQKGYNQFNPYPTAFPYGNGMVLHFYQQQESSTTKTVHKVINKGLKTYV